LNKTAYCGHVNQKPCLHKVTKLPSKDIESKIKKKSPAKQSLRGKKIRKLKVEMA